tara:strand:+ start:3833 stop:4426 length:594 start_codon:yes stop_codon:yes gene_type:complete
MDIKSKDNSKEQILEAAMKVFVKNGFSETRMDDIAENSGLSKGAIYHHYKSKKDLFLALIDFWEEYFFFKVFFNKDVESKNSADLLRDMANDMIETFKNRKYILLAELEFWSLANHDEDVRAKTEALYIKLMKLIRTIISKGVSTNEFKKIDVDVAALSVMTSLQGVIWFSIFQDKNISAEKYLNNVIEFIIFGFKK